MKTCPYLGLLSVELIDGLVSKLGLLELDQSADLGRHLGVLVGKGLDVGGGGVPWTEDPDQDNLTADGEDLGDGLDGRPLQGEVEGNHRPRRGRLVVLGQSLQPADLGLDVVDLQLGRLALDGFSHL